MNFNGSDYNAVLDEKRLTGQLGRIYACMIDGNWRTLSEISIETRDHEASVSAQLRNLRKKQFGGFIVEKRRRGDRRDGLFEYRVKSSTDKQMEMF